LLRDARQHAAQLEHEIRHDGLTGLANRSWVLENLGQRLGRGERTAVYFIDLDGFKEINDTLGHQAGDDALRVVAQRLEAATSDTTLVGRMGGDEFILVVKADDQRDLEALANEGLDIVARISAPMIAAGQEARLGASVGLAVQTSHGLDADQLVTRADTAMYTAKRAGGGVHVASTRLGGEMAA
jgi:diguanylate cyclase (GGDEF)-like protein